MAHAVRQRLSALTTKSWFAIGIFVVCLAAGCSTSAPHATTAAEPVRTQSQSPFLGLFSNTDPHAVRLDVRALHCGNSVGGYCVLIATVIDEQGKPMRNKRVEWTLEGAGVIHAADERGGLVSRRGKVESRYAVTETGRSAQRIPRNTGRPEDDVALDAGETWCVVTSALEGTSVLSAYAPEVADLANTGANRVRIEQRWFDTAFTLPAPQGGRPGDRVPLSTRVFRQADNQPLPGYWVRYRYVEGPQVLLQPTGAHEALVTTDTSGIASSTVYQAAPTGGRTRLAIEVLRPSSTSATTPPVVVGRGEAVVDWQAPAVSLTHTGPINVALGQNAPFTITVRNNAAAATPFYTVQAALPADSVLVSSTPPANRDGGNLIWTLGELPGGATRQLSFVVQSDHLGSLTTRASVVTAEGLRAEQMVTADVVPPPAPKLEAALSAPTIALASAASGGGPLLVACQVTVRNPGTGPATNVVLSASFRPEILDHESKKNPVEIPVGTLRPGEARTLPLTLTPRGPGDTPIDVAVRADNGLTAKDSRTLKIIQPGLVVKLSGPATRYVGRPVEWSVEVKNNGSVPLQQVTVRDLLPPELQFVEAPAGTGTPEGRSNGGEVVWDVGVLSPNESRVLKLVAKGPKPAVKVTNMAYASAQVASEPIVPLLQTAKAEATLAIQGAAALSLKVTDTVDPLHVGERTQYKIRVTNQGSMDGERVQVVARIPPEMRVVAVWGPGQYRIVGDRLEFQPVTRLAPSAILDYALDVEPTKTGDVRFHVELSSATVTQPIVREESTIVR